MSKITFPGGNGGGGGGVSDHGGLAGLSDDDHTQYLLVDGTRNQNQLTIDATLAVSGATTVNAEINPLVSGAYVCGGDNIRWSEVNSNLIDGNTVSGINAGFSDQIYISGIAIGPLLGAGGVTDHGALNGLLDNDHPQYLLTSDFVTSGNANWYQSDGSETVLSGVNVGAGTQMYISGIAVGDFLGGGGGGNPVDSRAATGDITADTSGAYNLGSQALPWNSGFFNRVVVYAPNGSGWYIDVDNAGILQTTWIE